MAQSIQGYLHGLSSEHKRIATALLKLVQHAEPKASVAMKWDQIAFERNGPVCFIKSTPSGVIFGFWRGQELDSAKGMLAPGGKATALVNLTAEGDVKKDLFARWVKEAARLNLSRPRP